MVTSATGPAAGRASSEAVTAATVAAIATTAEPRILEVITATVTAAHDLARRLRLQPAELLAAAEFLTGCGKISAPARHEFLLLFDVLGVTMAVDTALDTHSAATMPATLESSVLGPFYRAGAPEIRYGGTVSRGPADGEPLHVSGRVLDPTGAPIPGAEIEVWSAGGNGIYENLDPKQPEMNLRGRLQVRSDGAFAVWTARPASYPIPHDGPVGALLAALGRHPMRPAHLHVIAAAPDHRTVVTELFLAGDPYLDSDAVFGVKPSLIVPVHERGDPDLARAAGVRPPFWAIEHDLVLAPGDPAPPTSPTASPPVGPR
jgi:protocatechuate 3,4-dioxygenase beta subunit